MYRPLTSKDLVKVPCGKCRECRMKLQDDWFVRIYYEWLYTKNVGGQTFFITLTYNNAHLPVVNTSDLRFTPLSSFLKERLADRLSIEFDEVQTREFLNKLDRYQDRYGTQSLEVPEFSHCCFNDDHLTAFFKSLRQIFNNKGFLKYEELPLKYYCATEYGDDKKRSHYHILVFVPKSMTPADFINCARLAWSYRIPQKELPVYAQVQLEYCRKSKGSIPYLNFSTPNTEWRDWHITYSRTSKRYTVHRQRGFVNYSRDKFTGVEKPLIEDIKGCKYITHYIWYYDNYIKDDNFERLKDYIKLFPDFSKIYGYEKYKDLIHDLRMLFPFRRSSYQFGACIMSQFSHMEEEDLKNELVKNEMVVLNETRTYSIPSYIMNRLMYDRESVPDVISPITKLTPLGHKVMLDLFDEKIAHKVRTYKETIDVLLQFVTDEDRLSFYNDYGIALDKCLPFGLFCVPFEDIAKFDIVLSGVSISHGIDKIDVYGMTANEILDNAFDIYCRQVDTKIWKDPPVVLFHDIYMLRMYNKSFLKDRCYNYLPQFKMYDLCLTAIDFIRHKVLERDAKSQNESYTKNTVVRDALYKFRYSDN